MSKFVNEKKFEKIITDFKKRYPFVEVESFFKEDFSFIRFKVYLDTVKKISLYDCDFKINHRSNEKFVDTNIEFFDRLNENLKIIKSVLVRRKILLYYHQFYDKYNLSSENHLAELYLLRTASFTEFHRYYKSVRTSTNNNFFEEEEFYNKFIAFLKKKPIIKKIDISALEKIPYSTAKGLPIARFFHLLTYK